MVANTTFGVRHTIWIKSPALPWLAVWPWGSYLTWVLISSSIKWSLTGLFGILKHGGEEGIGEGVLRLLKKTKGKEKNADELRWPKEKTSRLIRLKEKHTKNICMVINLNSQAKFCHPSPEFSAYRQTLPNPRSMYRLLNMARIYALDQLHEIKDWFLSVFSPPLSCSVFSCEINECIWWD